MAIPENHSQIGTNLPPARLDDFLLALEDGRCVDIPESGSMFLGSRGAKFLFEGSTYEMTEFYELTNTVSLCSASSEFIQLLIDEHEANLAAVVKERNFDKAKTINEKIENLKRLLTRNEE